MPITLPLNKVYFSDGYGLKAVDISALVGESQSQATTLLSFPTINYDRIQHIHGNLIDGYLWLALSFDGYSSGSDGYGATVTRDETDGYENFADGYHVDKAQITDNGIMYLVNQTFNRVEVYYGINKRPGRNIPDYIYNTTSTPAIFPGQILSLKIISEASLRYVNGTRIFVGTTEGMTRIEAYDRQTTDGYCDGYDGYGLSINYGIVGSGATYEVIGGTASPVVAIAFDEEKSIILVSTNNISNEGGLTQIALEGNLKILFMNEATGFLPSNNVRDIFGGSV